MKRSFIKTNWHHSVQWIQSEAAESNLRKFNKHDYSFVFIVEKFEAGNVMGRFFI